MLLYEPTIDAVELEARTGWAIKPEGACKGETCLPLPTEVRTADDRIDARAFAARLGMPIIEDPDHGVIALGPETGITGRVLTTAHAPELTLPDVNGDDFRLHSLRGQKVLLVAWASW